jgi:hypothetical protein
VKVVRALAKFRNRKVAHLLRGRPISRRRLMPRRTAG